MSIPEYVKESVKAFWETLLITGALGSIIGLSIGMTLLWLMEPRSPETKCFDGVQYWASDEFGRSWVSPRIDASTLTPMKCAKVKHN